MGETDDLDEASTRSSSDGYLPATLPARSVAVTDAQREAALAMLRDTLTSDDLSLEVFSSAASAVVNATSLDDLTAVVSRFAPPVRMTPVDRKLEEPLILEIASGTLKLADAWQVPRETRVSCRSGRVLLDLTAAEFDEPIVDLDLRCVSGTIEVIVPHAADVQFVRMTGRSGRVDNQVAGNGPFPGPVRIRISADTSSGRIIVRRPKPVAPATRRRWFRRRAIAS